MKPITIPRAEFDWLRFSATITEFTQPLTLGSVEAFVIAEHDKLILDLEDLTLDDEDVPDDPLERLDDGHELFAPFAVFRDFGELACADGDVIEVPDLDDFDEEQDEDDEDDEDTPQLTDEQRVLAEATICDENHSYGYLIALNGENLIFHSMLVNDTDGDCDVEMTENAGLVDEPMAKFVKSFIRKPARKSPNASVPADK
jgi:hypothetical protein